MPSRSLALLAALSLGTASCSRSPHEPVCFPTPDAIPTSEVEHLVLDDARSRASSECSSSDRQCSFSSIKVNPGTIHVSVEFATIDESGTCIFLVGDHGTYAYDSAGSFVDYFPGM